jgi:hypothetical protein
MPAAIIPTTSSAFSLDRRTRLLCSAGAVAVAGIVAASLFGMFHTASQTRGLQQPGELMELAGSCLALPSRAERVHCTQAVVAAYRERSTAGVVVAESR